MFFIMVFEDKLEILEERYKAYNGGTIQNINNVKTNMRKMWNKFKKENSKIKTSLPFNY
jgi:hypothetical protein